MGVLRTKYTHLTGTGTCQLIAGEGWLSSFYVNSYTTAITLKIWDSLSATGTIAHDTISLAAIGNHPMDNEHYLTGCYVSLGGTGSITFRTLEQVN